MIEERASVDAYESSFIFAIENFFDLPEVDETGARTSCISDPFSFCGWTFQLEVNPRGAYEGSEYISVKLANLSSTSVLLQYCIVLLPRSRDPDTVKKLKYEWSDPEGIVRFDGAENPNSKWGEDDYILVSDARDEQRQLVHSGDTLVFQCNIIIRSRVEFSQQPLTKMIKSNAGDEELLSAAKEDLVKVLGSEYNKAKKKMANEVDLVSSRFSSSQGHFARKK